MKVELLHNTPLWVAAKAIRKCWASEDKSDTVDTQPYIDFDINGYDEREYFIEYPTCGHKDRELIDRVGNKNKHASTLEHLVYSFDIDGISRACLQELARHRMASISVKSTRYTLGELRNEDPFYVIAGWTDDSFQRAEKYIVFTGNDYVDDASMYALENMRKLVVNITISNDIAKYALPEAYKTSLVWTINARSLQNFLSLRTDKAALLEIRKLANELYNKLPEDHKYLFVECVKVYDEK